MKLKTLKPRLLAATTRMQHLAQPATADRLRGRAGVARPATADRLRGRAGVARRAKWLAAHPLCCMCEAEGRVTAATVPDHVVPLWQGGPDDGSNLQSLCAAHHGAKTAAEAAERAGR